jgi:hypothetical protein
MIADTFVHSDGSGGLRVPQIIGALRIAQQGRILLADQPGAGKTAQAMVALELNGLLARRANILILCNVTGCQLTWSPEVHKRIISQYPRVVFADLTNPGVDRNGRSKKTMPSVQARDDRLAAALMEADDDDAPLITVGNYELLAVKPGQQPKMQALFGARWDAIIIDESHLVLPTDTDDLKKMTQFWRGLTLLPAPADSMRISVSGTPDRGELRRRYGHWKFLYPELYRDYWGWARTHFVVTQEKVGVRKDPRGGWVDVIAPMVGKLRSEEEWLRTDAERMIRRTKAEMLAGLPEKQWAEDGGIDLPMTPMQQSAYLDQLADMDAQVEDLEAEDTEQSRAKAQGLKLQFTLRQRQMATCTWDYVTTETETGTHTHGTPRVVGPDGSNKLAWLLDWMAPRGYVAGTDFDVRGGKVVLVDFLTQTLTWLQQELEHAGIASEVLTGDTSAPDKLRIQDAFQNGDLRVVLLSGFLGVSINLDAADDMIFIGSIHDPDKMEQAEDRIHRASRNHQVMFWRLASEDTIDQAILEIVDQKYKATRRMYDGGRGIEFARKMLPKGALDATLAI